MYFKHIYVIRIILNYFADYNGDTNKAKQYMNFKNYKQIQMNTDKMHIKIYTKLLSILN